jgi:site-specific DNA recombinase
MRRENRIIRCAIYTRKSSEEGLEMSFNSLDAQREACSAFIASQREEGWRALPTCYDDGGYSGGSMNRPALQKLLEDVVNGNVDTIVVYKVDRLTRSLADFARIVEALERHAVSFVSVTQAFNTTTSMGRLTLNVLLSFAQFEREVTGERIRDKIAASKRKGMWMGGRIPLGYDVRDGKLVVNQEEANLVNDIYGCYLKFGAVSKLKQYLDEHGITAKKRISSSGTWSGGGSFSRGALYQILQNHLYRGKIRHRDDVYAGEHDAIVPLELWERVQAQLRSDNQGRRNGLKMNCPSTLTGLLQDAGGNRFAHSHTVKNGKRYRYYVLQTDSVKEIRRIRLPAYDLERQVVVRLQSFLRAANDVIAELTAPGDPAESTRLIVIAAKKQADAFSEASSLVTREFIRRVIRRVVVSADRMSVEIRKRKLREFLVGEESTSSKLHSMQREDGSNDLFCLEIEARITRFGGEMRLVVCPESKPPAITPLLETVIRGYQWKERILAGEVPSHVANAKQLGLNEEYLRRVLDCAFLAPDIIEAILDSRCPADLTVKKLSVRRLPLSWIEQRKRLGFPSPDSSKV